MPIKYLCAFFRKRNRLVSFLMVIVFLPVFSACANPPVTALTTTSEAGNYDFRTLDLKKLVLKPDDLKDLFPNAGMSISQAKDGKSVRSLKVTYQTNSIEHTLAFSEGFETLVEVYSTSARAQQIYSSFPGNVGQTYKRIDGFDRNRSVYEGDLISPDGGYDTGNKEYLFASIQHNLLFTIRLRGPSGFTVSIQRINQLIDHVSSLAPQ